MSQSAPESRCLALRAASVIRSLLVASALTASALAAQAETIFDSNTSSSEYFGAFTLCYVCGNNSAVIAELGDIITFGGTARSLTSVNLTMAHINRAAATPAYLVDLTLSLYTVDASLNTSLLASRTGTYSIPAFPAQSAWLLATPFDFTGVVVPNTIYYGLSYSSADPSANSLAFALWDYFRAGAPYYGDGQSLPAGSDPGTVVSGPASVTSIVYGRLASNSALLVSSTNNGLGTGNGNLPNSGFTPTIQFQAIAVPEPAPYVMYGAGLLTLALIVRRRRSGH